jgi:hypothetical protein
MKFKWKGILIRETTRAEDLTTARRIQRLRRSKLAIERERRLKNSGETEALEALQWDINSLKAKPSPVERTLPAGQEKARM